VCPYSDDYGPGARIWLANNGMGLRTAKGDFFGKELMELKDE